MTSVHFSEIWGCFKEYLELSEAFLSMIISECALWEGSELTQVSFGLSVWLSAPVHIPAEPGAGPALKFRRGSETSALASSALCLHL